MAKFVHKYFSKMFRETQSRAFSREWSIMKRLYQIKNWSLLGHRLRRITRNGLSGEDQALLELYNECIVHIKENLNPYILVDIVEVIVRALPLDDKPLEMLFSLCDVVKGNSDALQYIRILQGQVLVHKYRNLKAAKVLVEELRAEIETHPDGVKQRNYYKFHILAAAYYFITAQWTESYSSRIKYLSQNLKTYPKNLWAEQAFLLAVNAMLVEGKYEFADVLNHRIMEGLRGDSREFIFDVLNIFRAGNVERFKEMRFFWMRVPELYGNESALMQRLHVINFLFLVAQRYILPCYIYFVEVAMELRVTISQVECVLRRAVSTELVQAVIHPATKVIEVHSIKPIYFEPLADFDLNRDEPKDSLLMWNDTD